MYACESEQVEQFDGLMIPGGLTHRCLDCGAEFDGTGRRCLPTGANRGLDTLGTSGHGRDGDGGETNEDN